MENMNLTMNEMYVNLYMLNATVTNMIGFRRNFNLDGISYPPQYTTNMLNTPQTQQDLAAFLLPVSPRRRVTYPLERVAVLNLHATFWSWFMLSYGV
jgi:hypothetical protein